MIDKEKVLRGLECCSNFNPPYDWDCPKKCPYSIESNPHRFCRFNPLVDDVIALLREQEEYWGQENVCPTCLTRWMAHGNETANYCPGCGRKVMLSEGVNNET